MNFFTFFLEIPNRVDYVNLIQLNVISNKVECTSADKWCSEMEVGLGATRQ